MGFTSLRSLCNMLLLLLTHCVGASRRKQGTWPRRGTWDGCGYQKFESCKMGQDSENCKRGREVLCFYVLYFGIKIKLKFGINNWKFLDFDSYSDSNFFLLYDSNLTLKFQNFNFDDIKIRTEHQKIQNSKFLYSPIVDHVYEFISIN